MAFSKHIPAPPLNNYIEHIVYASGSLPLSYLKELPDGGVNLVIELNPDTVNTVYEGQGMEHRYQMKHAWISGLQKQAICYKNNTNSSIISIRFKVGGFYALTDIPLNVLQHVGTEAEAVFGTPFSALYQRLLDAETFAEKSSAIEAYFLPHTIDQTVEHAVVQFISQHIGMPIDWLVHKSGYSQKHVIHLAKKHTGFSPKYLQRIHRFQRMMHEIRNPQGPIDWFSMIQRFGYYDQAHLIKEFSHFTGLSPTEFLDHRQQILANGQVSDMIFQLTPPTGDLDR